MNFRNLILLVLGHCTLGSTAPMLVLINGFIGVRLAPSEAWATLGMGTLVAGTALSTLPAASLAQRYGRRRGFLVAAGLCLTGCGVALLSLVLESFVLFCVAMALLGSTLAFVQQFRFAAAENAPPERISLAVSFILFAGIGAALIGPRLGVMAVDWVPDYPYMGSFLALMLLALFCGGLMWFYRGPAVTVSDAPASRLPARALWRGPYVLGVICGATSFAVMSLVMTATPISMHHHQGLSLADTSSVIQWHIVAMFLPSLATGFVIQRLGVYWVALLGILCNLACIYMALSGVSLSHYLAALVLLGCGWNALFMAGTQMVATTHPGPERFQAQANNDFVVFACQGVASLSAGFLLALIGWQGLNLVALAMLLVCLLSWLHIVLFKQVGRVQTAA